MVRRPRCRLCAPLMNGDFREHYRLLSDGKKVISVVFPAHIKMFFAVDYSSLLRHVTILFFTKLLPFYLIHNLYIHMYLLNIWRWSVNEENFDTDICDMIVGKRYQLTVIAFRFTISFKSMYRHVFKNFI